GAMYANGTYVEKNDFKAVKFLKIACDMDYANSCVNLGGMYENGYGVRKDISKALKFYGKACDLKYDTGCKNYARLKR
ncbi:tetratricopeptide repeat protein, partial [Campylobacter coli]